MKRTIKVLGIIALVAVIGFSLSTCKDDGGGWDPISTLISWSDNSTAYKLSVTELEGANSYTYLLSVGNSGYSTGTATISGNNYTFTPRETGGSEFAMSIDSEAKTVTTTSDYSLKLIQPGTNTTTTYSMPKLDATCEITEQTGGVEGNPFVGTWTASYGGTVKVSGNFTWSYSETGYSNSGSYAPIENTAIIYDSQKEFFGFARVTGNEMETLTEDGGYIQFTKK